MDRKALFQAAAVAAVVAFGCVLVMAVAGNLPNGVSVQPSVRPVSIEEFARATNDYPDASLGFFGADSLFILSYALVFVGLYAAAAERARAFALVGLGAGLLAAMLDALENAFFITYALAARNNMPLTNPDLPLLYVVTNLKWMAAFATLYAFGLVFPRRTLLEWAIAALMLLFPLVGVLGVANPSLIAIRGLFFLIGLPLFAWYFWQQSHVTSS